ncbi:MULTISPECIES: FMN-binding protein [Flavobacteriaceae]|uniref:FMN-binding protein n=1 Tax=Flavobacteriaceae TaxID=49546 RepID=UPI0014922299|nr:MULTISPECIES: FMN-binding protein [Allomuricauda]MDC6365697.1 FMN-binding protein [Muricauda sp. AC10]
MKANKNIILGLAVIFTAFFFFGFTNTPKISPKLQEKLNNAVQTTFEVEGFELQPLELNLGEDSLFKIQLESEVLGYAYLGKAPSMKDIFDYVVLFDPELDVKKAKVLIYRENHGRQIGSQRWLKQFIGKKPGDTIEYGNDVDAISGATISAKSMTQAVGKVLTQMKELKAKGLL